MKEKENKSLFNTSKLCRGTVSKANYNCIGTQFFNLKGNRAVEGIIEWIGE